MNVEMVKYGIWNRLSMKSRVEREKLIRMERRVMNVREITKYEMGREVKG